MSYNEVMEIDNATTHDTKALLADMPKGSVEVKAGKLFFTDPYNTTYPDQHLDILRKHGIKVTFSDSDFILTVESTGTLSPKEAIDTAVDHLTQSFCEFEEELKKVSL